MTTGGGSTEVLDGARRVHLVGIGGAGVGALAELFLARGLLVSGSDVASSSYLERLRALGARVSVPHEEGAVDGADVVVRTSAAGEENPEVRAARLRGIPVVGRAQALAWLMRGSFGVAVGGTHGKTSSTAMLGAVAQACLWDATVVVGGRPAGWEGNVRVGRGERFVTEADESDGSFLLLPRRAVIVTNVDDDHLEYWGSVDRLLSGVAEFVAGVGPTGVAVLCIDDERLRRLRHQLRVPVVTYGTAEGADYRLADVEPDGFATTFRLVLPGGASLGPVTLAAPGEHYARNAAGCMALALRLGSSPSAVVAGIEAYRGVDRRFQILGEASGVTVVDDYAHHPTELRAVLSSVRRAAPGRRVVAVFQPHRSSRTALLAPALAAALAAADVVVLLPVYLPAGEVPRPGVGSHLIHGAMAGTHPCVVTLEGGDPAVAAPVVTELLRPGDVLLTLGAGSVTRLGPAVLTRLSGGGR